MTIPLIILAVLSVIGGWIRIGIKAYYHDWIVDRASDHAASCRGRSFRRRNRAASSKWSFPSLVVVLGVASACCLYWDATTDPLDISILAHKFYFDEFYDRSLVGGQQLAARFLNWIDSWILDGLIIRGAAYVSVGVGELLRLFQTGSLQAYAFLFSLGGILLIYFTLFAH